MLSERPSKSLVVEVDRKLCNFLYSRYYINFYALVLRSIHTIHLEFWIFTFIFKHPFEQKVAMNQFQTSFDARVYPQKCLHNTFAIWKANSVFLYCLIFLASNLWLLFTANDNAPITIGLFCLNWHHKRCILLSGSSAVLRCYNFYFSHSSKPRGAYLSYPLLLLFLSLYFFSSASQLLMFPLSFGQCIPSTLSFLI